MAQAEASAATFVDRRLQSESESLKSERRQFGNSYSELSTPARELAERIDEYKLHHHRRFITYEELYNLIESLGYHR